MASFVAFTSARPLMGCMAALTFGIACSTMSVHASEIEMTFDLPAQPLKQALEQYDARTNLSVFFSSELTAGRMSSAVHGLFSPQQALHKLLEGTGLTVESAAQDAFVLVPLELESSVASQAVFTASRAYDGLVQLRIRQALCARQDLALGSYRLALRVQLDNAGRVQQVRLLDTTGDRLRDAEIIKVIQRVDIGQPPLLVGKPFVILVRPRVADVSSACPILH